MRKQDEKMNSESCFNRAGNQEQMFVLLSRDICAPAAIRAWIQARIVSGKNKSIDLELQEAEAIAQKMEQEKDTHKPKEGHDD